MDALISGWVPDSLSGNTLYSDRTGLPRMNEADLPGLVTTAAINQSNYGGQARIFFNSGQYGTEQMYSMSPA